MSWLVCTIESGVPVRKKDEPETCHPPSRLLEHARLLAEERQIVDVVHGQHVASVIVGRTPEVLSS